MLRVSIPHAPLSLLDLNFLSLSFYNLMDFFAVLLVPITPHSHTLLTTKFFCFHFVSFFIYRYISFFVYYFQSITYSPLAFYWRVRFSEERVLSLKLGGLILRRHSFLRLVAAILILSFIHHHHLIILAFFSFLNLKKKTFLS